MANLNTAIVRDEFLKELQQKIREEGSLTFLSATGGRQFIVSSGGLVGYSFKQPISVISVRGTGERSTLNPQNASLILDHSDSGAIYAASRT